MNILRNIGRITPEQRADAKTYVERYGPVEFRLLRFLGHLALALFLTFVSCLILAMLMSLFSLDEFDSEHQTLVRGGLLVCALLFLAFWLNRVKFWFAIERF